MKLTNKVRNELNKLLKNREVKKLLSFEKAHQLVIAVLLVLYLLLDVETPKYLANLVDTTLGNVVVMLLAVTLLLSSNIVVGLLALVAGYELIQRSRSVTGNLQLKQIKNAEKIKVEMLKDYNNYPVTLEEEVVSKMAPLVHDNSTSSGNFKPVLNNLHDASSVNE
jgi:hypothetical protein